MFSDKNHLFSEPFSQPIVKGVINTKMYDCED